MNIPYLIATGNSFHQSQEELRNATTDNTNVDKASLGSLALHVKPAWDTTAHKHCYPSSMEKRAIEIDTGQDSTAADG